MRDARIYADLQKTDDAGRLILTCRGTEQDLREQGIVLREGLSLDLWMDDGDDGNFDPLYFEGTVHYHSEAKCWVTIIEGNAMRNASQIAKTTEKTPL